MCPKEIDDTLPTEQPIVTANTQFQRRGFAPAAEVVDPPVTAAPAAPANPAPARDPVSLLPPEDAALIEITHLEAEELPLEGLEPEPVVPAAAAPALPAAGKIKIGTRDFNTQEEAWAYAEELENQRLADDAFRQGIEAGQRLGPSNPAPAAAPTPEEQEIDPLYYTNPKEYFRKLKEETTAQAKTEIRQEADMQARNQQTWVKFYVDNPDLNLNETTRDIVQKHLDRNFEKYRHVKTEIALKEIAKLAREELTGLRTALLPKEELARVRTAASPGGQTQVTQPKTETRTLSFVEQQRNIRAKRSQLNG